MRYDTLMKLPSPTRRAVLQVINQMEESTGNHVKVEWKDLNELLEFVESTLEAYVIVKKAKDAKVS